MGPVGHWLLGLLAALVLSWLLLLLLLALSALRLPPGHFRGSPRSESGPGASEVDSGGVGAQLREAVRLLPDVARLLARLARDPALPRTVRWRLWAAVGYLALPVDLVPDIIPVLGYADDVLVVALALRSVVRCAGPGSLTRHWPGTPAGLAVVRRLVGSGQTG